MTIFCYKKIDATMCLGKKLKARREEQGMSLSDLYLKTRIPLKYLQAIEDDNFSQLPLAKVFRLAYVRQVSAALGLNSESCAKQLSLENNFAPVGATHPRPPLRFHLSTLSIFARNIVLVSSVVFFTGYLVWQLKGIIEPPRLVVYSPLEGYVASQPATLVEGETDKETHLTINGQEIMVNEQGRFGAKINLSDGINTIIIQATKKHGKTTSVTRHLVVKQKDKVGQISLK